VNACRHSRASAVEHETHQGQREEVVVSAELLNIRKRTMKDSAKALTGCAIGFLSSLQLSDLAFVQGLSRLRCAVGPNVPAFSCKRQREPAKRAPDGDCQLQRLVGRLRGQRLVGSRLLETFAAIRSSALVSCNASL
jgi:hypothetical protein